jgi:hypothetical protein
MEELIKLLGKETLIVTDKATIDKLFDSLPKIDPESTSYGKYTPQPNLPNSRGIYRDGKEVYFVDIDEVDINLV